MCSLITDWRMNHATSSAHLLGNHPDDGHGRVQHFGLALYNLVLRAAPPRAFHEHACLHAHIHVFESFNFVEKVYGAMKPAMQSSD